MSSAHDDIIKQFREQQQKFAYYIIALCAAGIGFSVQQTFAIPLRITQIPLAIAVLSWGISIYCGLQFISIQISALYSNSGLIRITEGRHPLTGTHPEKIKIAAESILEGIDKKSKQTMKMGSWQNRLFYFGIICFVGWRIWEMYSLTKQPLK